MRVVVMHCSLAKSGRLICIARSWEFRFTMLTSVRVRRSTGSGGKTSLDLSKCFSRIGCWAYGRWLCCYTNRLLGSYRWSWLRDFMSNFLHHFCIISRVKPHLLPFRIQFHVPAFQLSQLPIFDCQKISFLFTWLCYWLTQEWEFILTTETRGILWWISLYNMDFAMQYNRE